MSQQWPSTAFWLLSLRKWTLLNCDKYDIVSNKYWLISPYSRCGYLSWHTGSESLCLLIWLSYCSQTIIPVIKISEFMNPHNDVSLKAFPWFHKISTSTDTADYWKHQMGMTLTNHYYDDRPVKYFHKMPAEFDQMLQMHSQGVLRLHLGDCKTGDS